jgi:hypothetical protein
VRCVGAWLILALLPFSPGQAYFTVTTGSAGTFTAGELVAALGLDTSAGTLGVQHPSFSAEFGLEHTEASLQSEFSFRTESVGHSGFCDALRLRVTGGGDITMAQAVAFTYGPVPSVNALRVFTADLSVLETDLSAIPHGAGCDLTLVSESVLPDTDVTTAGFFDVQRITWRLTAQQVVLNEVLANPGPGGEEFIELFNAGSEPVDVAGWVITEETSGGSVTAHTIKATSTAASDLVPFDGSENTLVPAGGHLALKFVGNTSYLNNDGDTITLFDVGGMELDSYTYTTSLVGKSDARIPDGTGDWIDPVPTPGLPNRLELSLTELSVELSAAGLRQEGDGAHMVGTDDDDQASASSGPGATSGPEADSGPGVTDEAGDDEQSEADTDPDATEEAATIVPDDESVADAGEATPVVEESGQSLSEETDDMDEASGSDGSNELSEESKEVQPKTESEGESKPASTEPEESVSAEAPTIADDTRPEESNGAEGSEVEPIPAEPEDVAESEPESLPEAEEPEPMDDEPVPESEPAKPEEASVPEEEAANPEAV